MKCLRFSKQFGPNPKCRTINFEIIHTRSHSVSVWLKWIEFGKEVGAQQFIQSRLLSLTSGCWRCDSEREWVTQTKLRCGNSFFIIFTVSHTVTMAVCVCEYEPSESFHVKIFVNRQSQRPGIPLRESHQRLSQHQQYVRAVPKLFSFRFSHSTRRFVVFFPNSFAIQAGWPICQPVRIQSI